MDRVTPQLIFELKSEKELTYQRVLRNQLHFLLIIQ
jgi:hypothetical protein